MLQHFCKSCRKKDYCTFPCDNFINQEFESQWAGEKFDPTRKRMFDKARKIVSDLYETDTNALTQEEKREKTRDEYIHIYYILKAQSPSKHTCPFLHFKPMK